MSLPLQNINEIKKDPTWAQSCVTAIVQMVGSTHLSKQKDKFCYDLYNGIFNEGDYDYLRKVDKYEYPAKIRFMPLIRPRLDRLTSEQTKRPFIFRVFTVDQVNLQRKENQMSQAIIDMIYGNVFSKVSFIESLQENLQKQFQQIEQLKQGQQQVPPEQLQQLEEIQKQLKLAMAPLAQKQMVTQADLEKIEAYYKFEDKDWLEILAEKGVNFLIQEYDLKNKFNDGFIDELVTDKEYYFADYHPGDPDPIMRRVTPLNFYYSNDEEAEWVGDCEWAMEERYMTLPQIIDEFKADLSTLDVENLKKSHYYYGISGYNGGTGYQFDQEQDYNTENCNGLYAGTTDYGNKIRVCYCTWQSVRQLKFKKSPNRHIEGTHYLKWLEDKDDQIDKLRKGEEHEIGYVNDVWEGVQIDRNVFIRLQKRPVQLRSVDNYGKVQLPYIGRAFNGINKRPYSIVWAAKDVQLLYNLIHYHKELWLALSGVKGFIMDKSQLPDGMSQQEWIYQRKTGVGWIQTVREGLGRQPTFNQFQHYDDTVTPAIQYLTGILQHLEELAGQITGVSRQSLGAMVSGDLKGVTEQAITQSSLVTEILFYKHDQVKKKALERLINLCKIAWKDGKRGQYVLGSFGQEMLNIPKGAMDSCDFQIWVDDNGKQQRAIQEIRQLAFAEHSKGLITLPQIVGMYDIDNLKQLEALLEKYGKVAEQKAASQFQSSQQAEMEKIKMEQELTAALEKEKISITAMAQKLEEARFGFEQNKFTAEQALASKTLEQDKYLEELKIESERQVELLYLEEQRQEAKEDAKIANKQIASNHKINIEKNSIQKQSKSKEQIK